MKGKEGTGDPGGPDAKSGRYSSGTGLCLYREKGLFADVASADSKTGYRLYRTGSDTWSREEAGSCKASLLRPTVHPAITDSTLRDVIIVNPSLDLDPRKRP